LAKTSSFFDFSRKALKYKAFNARKSYRNPGAARANAAQQHRVIHDLELSPGLPTR
jgi:transketolase C-terminal domain/subunit